METADLKQRITQGENTTTEFKENFDQEVIETTVAFANTHGGVILIGVSDKGEIRGITIGKETLSDVSNRIAQATEPRVIVEVESVAVEGQSVLLVHIAETSIKPISVRGDAIRESAIATASCLRKKLPRCIWMPWDRVGINFQLHVLELMI